jgi:hypothetical protein
MGGSQEAYQALYNAVRDGWEAIPSAKFDRLTEGMKERVLALTAAEGWHTKY